MSGAIARSAINLSPLFSAMQIIFCCFLPKKRMSSPKSTQLALNQQHTFGILVIPNLLSLNRWEKGRGIRRGLSLLEGQRQP
jgi:hypothetical protein